MKKALVLCLLPLAILGLTWAPANEVDASGGVNLSYAFIGCDGQVADFDLTASSATGGTYLWSFGVTPISSPTANPNYASTSAVTWKKMVSVTLVTKQGTFRDNAIMINPCIEDPDEL